MRIEHADRSSKKGWLIGPWNAELPLAVGYANEGIDAPHYHVQMTEIYLVARGWSEVRIEREDIRLEVGDLLIVEPGEAHTFRSSSSDYLHFVIHVPALPEDEAKRDRVAVSKSRFA